MIGPESDEATTNLSKEELLEIERVCDAFEDRLRSDDRYRTLSATELEFFVENSPSHLRNRMKSELTQILVEWNEFYRSRSTATTKAMPDEAVNGNHSATDEPAVMVMERLDAEHRRIMQERIPPRFVLKKFLGEGATAEVWLAADTKLNREVAIKIAHHSGSLSPLGFLREARSNSRLKHKSIVRVLEIAPENTWQYLVCEYIEGESLAKLLARESPSLRTCATWIASLADALAHAHSLGVVHRDIKPQNILIDRSSNVHITDFGIAKDFTDPEATHTRTGRFVGTPAFMSPQQTSGQTPASPLDDVYSLGIVFYKMLTGDVPFHGNAQSVAFQVIHSEPQTISELRPEVPKDLELLCLKCIEKRPADRLPSAAFLRDELQRYLRQESLVSRPNTRKQLLIKWVHQNPKLARSLATSFSLLILLTGVSLGFAWKLNSSWKKERLLRVLAEQSEQKTQEALNREKAALEKAQREVNISDQVVGFMEKIFQSNDPVYTLQEPNGHSIQTLQTVLDSAAARIDEELRDQPQLRSRLVDILGNSYRATGYPDQAMRLFKKAEELREDKVGEKSDAGLHEYYLGCWHHEQGDLNAAKTHYEQALELFSAADAESSRAKLAMSDVEFQLGRLFIDRRDNATALTWMTRCLEHRRDILAEDSPRLRATEVAIMLCKVTDASSWSEQLSSMIGNESTWYNSIVRQFAELTLARRTLPPEKVKPLFEGLIQSLEESLSSRHAISLLAQGDYASWLHDQGDYQRAYPVTTKLIEIANSVAPNHPRLVEAKIRFGYELLRSQKYEEANRNYTEVLDARTDPFSGMTEALEGKLWCSIVLGQTMGLSDLAMKLDQQLEKRNSFESAWLAYCLARCYRAMGEVENERKHDAIALDKAQSCHPVPDNSMWLERLATIQSSHSQHERAAELLKKAVAIERTTRPAKHPRLADRLLALGDCQKRLGKADEAKVLFLEALEIYQLRMPPGDQRIEQAQEHLERLVESKSHQETIE